MQEMFASQASGNLAGWLALVVGAIALYFAMVGPLRRASRKELSFGSSDIAILPPPLIEVKGLTVQLHDEKIEGLHALNLFVMNTGNTVIEARDFDGPIAFEFSEVCNPLGLHIQGTHPTSLPVSAEVVGRRILVQPLLLNPGDFFAVFVGVVGKSVEVEPSARVSGISEFPRLLAGETGVRELDLFMMFAATTVVLAIGVFAVFSDPTRTQYWLVAAVGVALCTAAIALLSRFKAIKRARWMGKGTEMHNLTPATLYQLWQADLESSRANATQQDDAS